MRTFVVGVAHVAAELVSALVGALFHAGGWGLLAALIALVVGTAVVRISRALAAESRRPLLIAAVLWLLSRRRR